MPTGIFRFTFDVPLVINDFFGDPRGVLSFKPFRRPPLFTGFYRVVRPAYGVVLRGNYSSYAKFGLNAGRGCYIGRFCLTLSV